MEDLVKGRKNEQFRGDQLNGIELNSAWKVYSDKINKGHSIQNTDFTSNDLSKFTLDSLIDVFNFYRLYVSSIDKIVLSKISRDKLLDCCENEYEVNYGKSHGNDYEKFSIKFRRAARMKLNLTIEDDEIRKRYKIGI